MGFVPGTGLEPAPPCEDYTLNVACLPISPSGLHAVRVGFEPTVPVKVQRFSRPPDSTTLAPHLFISLVCMTSLIFKNYKINELFCNTIFYFPVLPNPPESRIVLLNSSTSIKFTFS